MDTNTFLVMCPRPAQYSALFSKELMGSDGVLKSKADEVEKGGEEEGRKWKSRGTEHGRSSVQQLFLVFEEQGSRQEYEIGKRWLKLSSPFDCPWTSAPISCQEFLPAGSSE